MKNNVYIIGSSLICSLGKQKEEIYKNIKNIYINGYESYVKQQKKEKLLYKITYFNQNLTQKFYESIKYVVLKAIKDAKLSNAQKEDLHIFIGSTSMKVSLDEDKLTRLGYGVIGEFIQSITGSKQDFKIIATACTSSANALCYASKMIQENKIKNALVIGLEFFNKSTFEGFESFMLLSKKGIYRPFDKKADGVILGEGCSALVLSSEKKTENDFKYLGSWNICDIYSETTSNPDGKSIFTCMDFALNNAKLNLSKIDFIKAHGTGSQNNTEAETNALKSLFKKHNHKVPISILKPYIGHTLGACGTNEIALMLFCINKSFIPASLGFENGKNIDFEILHKAKKTDKKVTILFNYIGFSGNNTSIILSNK